MSSIDLAIVRKDIVVGTLILTAVDGRFQQLQATVMEALLIGPLTYDGLVDLETGASKELELHNESRGLHFREVGATGQRSEVIRIARHAVIAT